ncbi:MAG TPA: GerMN domain-containing protein [Geobacteraceae bacterium]|nr:GerMN domain-containing protein [Geobacteraceae bacterium]
MKKNRRPPGDRSVLIIAFIICALVLGALMLKKYEARHQKPPVSPPPQQQGAVLVTLFFASPDGGALVREGREIDACGEPSECIEDVLDELINGPLGNLTPTLPSTTTVRDVRIEGEKLLIDLGDEIVKGLPGGSNSEMLAVYSIVDTVAINFPRIKLVRFTINGKTVETLNGHLDLSEPLQPDFSLEKKPQG